MTFDDSVSVAGGLYENRRVLVAGVGVAGVASVRALLAAGATVTVVNRQDHPVLVELAEGGARVVVVEEFDAHTLRHLYCDVTDVVVSPGFPPHHLIAVEARKAGLDIYSEPELAWRLRGKDPVPWLAVTGTNGKTTTVTMLEAIFHAAGLRTRALGNIGVPLVDATTVDEGSYDALVVELSSFQLHWSSQLAPEYAAILNLADDHLDWHGDRSSYARAKASIWRAVEGGDGVGVGNDDDPWIRTMMATMTGTMTGTMIGWTLGEPAVGQLGVVDGMLVNLCPDRGPVELVAADKIRPVGRHNVANALAAAALASAYGLSPQAIRDGLVGYAPQPHRNASVAIIGGVHYVDDSKATNPHAALASLLAFPRVVWIAGGQLKGVDVNDLVRRVADRLVGVVLLGVDRALIADALSRHAPDIRVIDISCTDDQAMGHAVDAAVSLAYPGDTVVLAPAAASLDMFDGYVARGRAFVAAVMEHDSGSEPTR